MAKNLNTAEEKDGPRPGMGAIAHEGGTTFRVWAPHADAVSVVGNFNDWSPEADPLAREEDGYWAADVAEASPGDEYKFQVVNGDETLERIDPYTREVTHSDGVGLIQDGSFDWGEADDFEMPAWNELVIYEMHVGTFNDEPGGEPGDFGDAIEKIPYLRDLGINAIEVMPPMEFPGGFSWGYNPALPFAVEGEYGGPRAFKAFIKAAHEAGIAVLLDVVYNHLGPGDLDLWRFDGWHEGDWGGIYFYNDERAKTPWGDTRPDYGRGPVRRYLRDNALMWLDEYRVDGLRWDGTAYIRSVDGNTSDPDSELPDGWSLMQWINDELDERFPWKISIAEDFRASPWILKGTGAGGAGFDSQWDGAFVHPVRAALIAPNDDDRDVEAVRDAIIHRVDGDAFGRVIYVESHDEVANGQARLPEEIMPGQTRHWLAKKRSTLGGTLVLTSPGIPMLFQGQEFLEDRWFQDTDPLDWHLAEELDGVVDLFRDLIGLRRNQDGTTRGLVGQHVNVFHANQETKVLAFHRWDEGGPGDDVVVVANLRNEPVADYVIGLPRDGLWRLRFDSHGAAYDDEFEDQISADTEAEGGAWDGMPYHGKVSVAPYSALVLSQDE